MGNTVHFKSVKETRGLLSHYLFVVLCVLFPFFFLHCATTIPVPIVHLPAKKGKQIYNILKGKRNLTLITANSKEGKKIDKETKEFFKKAEKWDESMEAGVRRYVTDLGYFKLVDKGNRKARLKELVYSQSGLTKESLAIGRELQANAMLVVRMTRPPQVHCKMEWIDDPTAVAVSALAIVARTILLPDSKGGGGMDTARKTGVLYVSIFVEGMLTNVETGLSIGHFYSKTIRSPSESGNLSCSSPLKSYSLLLNEASKEIAHNLSPSVKKIFVSLMETSPDLQKNRLEVESYLTAGIQWATKSEMGEAKVDWENALRVSKNKSAGAIWNLAVYHWHVGEFGQADDYFQQFKKKKRNLIDSTKREVLTSFAKARKLVLE